MGGAATSSARSRSPWPRIMACSAEDEIEVTPKMIAAGADVIWTLSRDVEEGWVSADHVAKMVWEAMIERA